MALHRKAALGSTLWVTLEWMFICNNIPFLRFQFSFMCKLGCHNLTCTCACQKTWNIWITNRLRVYYQPSTPRNLHNKQLIFVSFWCQVKGMCKNIKFFHSIIKHITDILRNLLFRRKSHEARMWRRKGLLAPQNTFLDHIGARFDGTREYFITTCAWVCEPISGFTSFSGALGQTWFWHTPDDTPWTLASLFVPLSKGSPFWGKNVSKSKHTIFEILWIFSEF